MRRSQGLQPIFADPSRFWNCSVPTFVCAIAAQNLFLSDNLIQSSRFFEEEDSDDVDISNEISSGSF